jgi:hypothetical protein
MKYACSMALISFLAATSASAITPPETTQEARGLSSISCVLKDASGATLHATSTEGVNPREICLWGSGESFEYRVSPVEESFVLTLTDLRSGDAAEVTEGDFDVGEKVTITLKTDEAPDEALTLECVGS